MAKQRTYQFSNDLLITSLLDDLGTASKKSRSQVIETVLEKTYLPTHSEAKYWAENLLLQSANIGETLSAAFDYLAAGTSWKAQYDNGYPLIQYAQNFLLAHPIFLEKQDHDTRQYLSNCLRTLIELVEKKLASSNKYINEISSANEICDILKSDEKFSPIWIYSFILRHWDILKNSTHTYRFLAQFVLIHQNAIYDNRDNTPAERLELLQTLKFVSQEWKGSINNDYLQEAINRIDAQAIDERNIHLLLSYLTQPSGTEDSLEIDVNDISTNTNLQKRLLSYFGKSMKDNNAE